MANKRFQLNPLQSAHLGFYDTTETGTLPVKTETGFYYNLPQALLCVDLAKQALKAGYETIGIVSAYRAQTNLIQKMLQTHYQLKTIKRCLQTQYISFRVAKNK